MNIYTHTDVCVMYTCARARVRMQNSHQGLPFDDRSNDPGKI